MPAGHWRRRCCRAVGCLLPSQTAAREGGTRESGDCTLFRKTGEALVSRLTRASPDGVSDGARTRDTQDHNLVLYQLSYTHHGPAPRARWRNRSNDTGGGQAPGAPRGAVSLTSRREPAASPASRRAATDSTTSSAAARACSLLGPGAGTNKVRR